LRENDETIRIITARKAIKKINIVGVNKMRKKYDFTNAKPNPYLKKNH